MWNWPMMNFDALTRCFEHEIFEHGCHHEFFWTRITRMTRIFFGTRLSPISPTFVRGGALTVFWTRTTRIKRIFLFGTRISPVTRMHVRVGTLTWGLLNENDTNEIKTDSIRSFVNTHCLRLVLKVVSFYSFSPTIGKKAFIVLTYRKSSKSSLLYIIQCLKSSSEDTSF